MFNSKRDLVTLAHIFKVLESITVKLVDSEYNKRLFYEKELEYWKNEYQLLISGSVPKNKQEEDDEKDTD